MTILALSYAEQRKVNTAPILLMHQTSFDSYLLQFFGIVLTWKIDLLRRNTITFFFLQYFERKTIFPEDSNEICKVGKIEASACPAIKLVALICGCKTIGMDSTIGSLKKKNSGCLEIRFYAW